MNGQAERYCSIHGSGRRNLSLVALPKKGLVQRRQGDLHASLATFQRLLQLHPNNVETAKQVARSLCVSSGCLDWKRRKHRVAATGEGLLVASRSLS